MKNKDKKNIKSVQGWRPPEPSELETDEHKIKQRKKQIVYGKLSPEYKIYSENVLLSQRGPEAPWTPRIDQKCSKRSFDGQVKKWRVKLHEFVQSHPEMTPSKAPNELPSDWDFVVELSE